MEVFLKVLREKQCLQSQKPEFKLDPIVIVVDKDGRIYGSSSDPKPYKLTMKWCSYEVEALGNVQIQAAMREPPKWGFRFRPKATLGYLPLEGIRGTWADGIDGGLLLEPFYWHSLNFNGYVGVRSIGAGVGVDIMRNFGAYSGYSITWGAGNSGLFTGLWFSFL
jgi:hypothetical protein